MEDWKRKKARGLLEEDAQPPPATDEEARRRERLAAAEAKRQAEFKALVVRVVHGVVVAS